MRVYGGSFGGYSALMSVIRAPKLFKCAVGYAGIYELKMMYDQGDISQSKAGRSYLNTVIGRNDAELDANSPDKLAHRIVYRWLWWAAITSAPLPAALEAVR